METWKVQCENTRWKVWWVLWYMKRIWKLQCEFVDKLMCRIASSTFIRFCAFKISYHKKTAYAFFVMVFFVFVFFHFFISLYWRYFLPLILVNRIEDLKEQKPAYQFVFNHSVLLDKWLIFSTTAYCRHLCNTIFSKWKNIRLSY